MAGFAAAALLSAVHLISGLFPQAGEGRARRRWMSVASGVAVAFVFVFLLPELATTNRIVHRQAGGPPGRWAATRTCLPWAASSSSMGSIG